MRSKSMYRRCLFSMLRGEAGYWWRVLAGEVLFRPLVGWQRDGYCEQEQLPRLLFQSRWVLTPSRHPLHCHIFTAGAPWTDTGSHESRSCCFYRRPTRQFGTSPMFDRDVTGVLASLSLLTSGCHRLERKWREILLRERRIFRKQGKRG